MDLDCGPDEDHMLEGMRACADVGMEVAHEKYGVACSSERVFATNPHSVGSNVMSRTDICDDSGVSVVDELEVRDIRAAIPMTRPVAS